MERWKETQVHGYSPSGNIVPGGYGFPQPSGAPGFWRFGTSLVKGTDAGEMWMDEWKDGHLSTCKDAHTVWLARVQAHGNNFKNKSHT